MRPLSEHERTFILGIAKETGGAAGEHLTADVNDASADDITDDGSLVGFEIANYVHPTSGGQQAFIVEGRLQDSDGCDISAVLYTDANDRLLEMELIRWGDGSLKMPRWDTLHFFGSANV